MSDSEIFHFLLKKDTFNVKMIDLNHFIAIFGRFYVKNAKLTYLWFHQFLEGEFEYLLIQMPFLPYSDPFLLSEKYHSDIQ